MKKAVVFLLVSVLCFTLVSCKGKNAEETSTENVTVSVTAESSSGKETSDAQKKDGVTETSAKKEKKTETSSEKESVSTETTKKSSGVKMTMEIYSDDATFRVVDSERVGDIYDKLNELKYKKSETADISGGVGVYFYDKDNKEIKSFYIKDNYLKVSGDNQMYEITDKNFDYKEFKQELLKAVGNDLDLE